jgi:hypothetical protein
MSPEKWKSIKGRILDSFKNVEEAKEALEEPAVGEKEILEFAGPLGRMRLEFITRPVVLDKVTHGSRRIGSEHGVEYIYSQDEFFHALHAYKWDDNSSDWLEIDLKNSFNL